MWSVHSFFAKFELKGLFPQPPLGQCPAIIGFYCSVYVNNAKFSEGQWPLAPLSACSDAHEADGDFLLSSQFPVAIINMVLAVYLFYWNEETLLFYSGQ